jgi:hypothetical protein
MDELVNEMTHVNPARRPPIDRVVERLAQFRESLSGCKLRSIIKPRKEPSVFTACKRVRQAARTIRYILSNRPAIPEHSPDRVVTAKT